MPIEMAPLRLTFAFSRTSTVASGRASLALIAATEPALPPPITSTSASSVKVSGTIMRSHLSSETFQPQAVADPVGPDVQMLVIDRRSGDVVGQAVDEEQRRTRRHAELQRDLLLGGHRADLVIGGAQAHTAHVFEEPEDVAPREVLAGEAPAEVRREVAMIEGDGRIVHEPHAPDLEERRPRRHAEAFGHVGGSPNWANPQHARRGLEALRGHRLGEPGELGETLDHRGASDEAPAALEPEHEAIALQLAERLPGRDAADRVLARQFVLGRQAVER